MRALWGRGLAISGENRGFTSAWILRYPILRSTQIIGSIEVNSDVPATEAGSFQTFWYCWKVRLHILALWFQTFPTCPSLLLRGRSVFQHSAGYSMYVAQVSHSSVLPQELRVDLKLGVFENGRYLIGNMRIQQWMWDALYFGRVCFQELHCPFCSCLEGSKKLAAKAFPSALFHSLLLDFVVVKT